MNNEKNICGFNCFKEESQFKRVNEPTPTFDDYEDYVDDLIEKQDDGFVKTAAGEAQIPLGEKIMIFENKKSRTIISLDFYRKCIKHNNWYLLPNLFLFNDIYWFHNCLFIESLPNNLNKNGFNKFYKWEITYFEK